MNLMIKQSTIHFSEKYETSRFFLDCSAPPEEKDEEGDEVLQPATFLGVDQLKTYQESTRNVGPKEN